MKILQGKIFGMPRTVFFGLVIAGVALGLYLRKRNISGEGADNAATAEDYGGDYGEPLGSAPTDPAAQAGGVGIATQPAGSVIPVSTPYVPEGFEPLFGTLGGVISDLAAGYNPPNAVAQPADTSVPVTAPATGGGPPVAPPHSVVKRKPVVIPRNARVTKTPGGRTKVVIGKKTVFVPKGTPVRKAKARR